MSITLQSDFARLGSVVVKHARDAMIDDQQIDAQWQSLNYSARPELQTAISEYQHFADALVAAGAELIYLPQDDSTGLDSLYPRDAAIVCEQGAILCSMGKSARRKEPQALRSLFEDRSIPVCGEITGDGRLEGGDFVWLSERIAAVGCGYRTNPEGIRQLRELLGDYIDELIVVALPHWQGPNDVFHLMSMISPVDADLMAVFSPLLPVPFRERLLEMNMQLIEIPADEFVSQACNILAVAPRMVIMADGNPITHSRLLEAGVEVMTYSGENISLKGGGGPTCLTRPLERHR